MRTRISLGSIWLARNWIGALAVAAAAMVACLPAEAFDESKYPDFAGQWKRPPGVANQWDITKPNGLPQQAPLTPEYQKIFEESIADQAEGGQGNDPTGICIPDGMPRAMNVIFPMEIVIQPKVTHIMIEYLTMLRRIFTDGREFPEGFEPSFMGYSIGKWIDENGDGKYDVLEIETRLLKGPRSFEPSGLPLHRDNQTIVRERLYLDKDNHDLLHDDVTTVDNALTRPWTVNKRYVRVANPIWVEAICSEGNDHLKLGGEDYMISADGFIMPAKKHQAPPDLKFFK